MRKSKVTLSMLVIFSMLLLTACSGVAARASASTNSQGQQAQASALLQQATAAPSQAPTAANNSNSGTSSVSTSSGQNVVGAMQTTLENIYNQVQPSVVSISVITKQSTQSQVPSPFFGFPGLPNQQQTPQYGQALGSGFVWDKQGHIVTNNHVVESATKIEVSFSGGTTVPATVVGTDPDNDLAVIKVNLPANQLHPVTMGNSQQVKVGQMVVAIGNPFGEQWTMTSGIVSGLGRTLPAGNNQNATGPQYTIPDIIQTDAPINPGNSGGVLTDLNGKVLGVTSAIESPVRASSGIGFVIPSAIVQKEIPTLIKSGHYDHPYLGISGTTLTPELAKAMNLGADQKGALVEQVTAGGPAAQAGIIGSSRQVQISGQNATVGGDVITAVNGQAVKSMDDLIAYLNDNTSAGQKVTLTVLRNGKETSVDVTLGIRPGSQSNQATTTQSVGQLRLGILGVGLNPQIARAMNLPSSQQGVLIEQVSAGSPADKAGLRGSYMPATVNGQQVLVGGDVITAINNQSVAQPGDLQAYLAHAQAGQQVNLSILRNGRQMQVSVTLEASSTQTP
ncbi:MAG: PDZ domain-containing protein [Anaerolineales bacterium]|jgi:serine protease Do